MATNTDLIQQLYVAYFNRPADVAGLNYWLNAMTNGATIDQISKSFNSAKEYTDAYAGKSAEVIVNTVYQNLFGRTADSAGLDFWGPKVQSGAISVADLVKTIAAGAVGTDGTPNADGLVYANKVSAAVAFTTEINAAGNEAERLAYASGSTAALTAAKNYIASVTTDASLATAIANVHATAQSLVTVTTPVTNLALTTGADSLLGGAGNDVFNAVEGTGAANTFTVGDYLDGGAGNDTLNIVQTGAFSNPLSTTVSNIETVNLISGTTASNINTTSWSGVTALNVTAPGAVTATAAASTAISVTDATLGALTATVNGGSTVNVTTTSVGTGSNISVGATTAAAGAVTVNATTNMADTAGATTATGTAVTVKGGTTITVNATLAGTGGSDAGGDTLTGGAINITGNASTTAVTVNQTAAGSQSTSGGTPAIVDGQVAIADKNASSLTAAGTIKTVTINGFGGTSTVNSGALDTINLSGTGAALTVTNGSLTTPTVTTQALNVNGLTTTGAVTLDSDITTLNVNASTADSEITSLVANGVTKLNVAGNAALVLDGQTLGALTDVTVTNTAGVTLGTALATGVTFTGGAGNDEITLTTGFTKTINMGAGNDVVHYAAQGTGGTVAAGAGTDTIAMNASDAVTASGSATFNSKFTGFEVLDVTIDGTTQTINLAGINGVNNVVTRGITAGDTLTLNGFASGGTLTLDAAGSATGIVAANVTNAVLTPSDTFNVKLSNSTAATVEFGKVQLDGIETVNITTVDAGTGSSAAATVDTATLIATSATKVVVTGNDGLNLTNTGNTAITTFDASGVVANSSTDTAAGLGVTFASANNTTTATVTIIGGAGNDVLTGNAAKDVITGGAGNDIITGGTGADTLNVGVGHDILVFNTNSDAQVLSSDSTTASFDVVNGFKAVTTAITTGVNFSSYANIFSNTGGNADLSFLNIVAKVDDGAGGTNGNAQAVSVAAAATGAAQAAGTTFDISSKGLLTLSGAGASAVDTLAEWIVEANAANATTGKAIAFQFGGDTYVFVQNGAQDVLIDLVGVSGTGLVLASASTTASAGNIIIGSALS